jgi:hypothetical protein
MPREHAEVEDLTRRVPEAAALRRLRELGFTTVVVHHPMPLQRALRRLAPFDFAAQGSEPALQRLHRTDSMTAYAILAGSEPEAPAAAK